MIGQVAGQPMFTPGAKIDRPATPGTVPQQCTRQVKFGQMNGLRVTISGVASCNLTAGVPAGGQGVGSHGKGVIILVRHRWQPRGVEPGGPVNDLITPGVRGGRRGRMIRNQQPAASTVLAVANSQPCIRLPPFQFCCCNAV